MSETRKVGKYELISRLGEGSYAKVYRGRDGNTGEEYALKVISKDKLGDPRLQDNLDSEISIMRDYLHENIVRLYDHFNSSRYIYLVLELCKGDLSKYIKSCIVLEERVVHKFLQQLAHGLLFLHKKNLIHRDLKPANVLLTEFSENATLKLADFGFAKHLAEASMAQTPCGTPLYMAPEIFEMHEYDAKADLWSVGCIMYEMLVGQPPFRGSNPRELFNNIKTKSLVIPPQISISSQTLQLLKRLLERTPIRRINMDEFYEQCMSLTHSLTPVVSPADTVAVSTTPSSVFTMAPVSDASVKQVEVTANEGTQQIAPVATAAVNDSNVVCDKNKQMPAGTTTASLNNDDDFVIIDTPVMGGGGVSGPVDSVDKSKLYSAYQQVDRQHLLGGETLLIANHLQRCEYVCDIIASIVSVADSMASDAIALEDTKPLLGYRMMMPDPTASSSTRPRGESYDGQIISSYTGSCSLYIHTINLLKDTMMATVSMFQSLGRSAIHQPTFVQIQEKLVVLYDQLLDRIKHSQQKLVMNTKVYTLTSPEPLMYKAAMQLAREANVEELLGNLIEAQRRYANAKLLIEAVMITATDPNDRRNLLFFAKEFSTCQTVCSQFLK